MKKLPIILMLAMMLMLPAAFAITEWTQYDNSFSNYGFYTLLQAHWNGTGSTSSIADGAAFQPLIADLDNDSSVMEVIGSDGNYLKIWQYSSNTLTLADEENMGSTQDAMMNIIPDFNDNGLLEIAGIFNGINITVFEFNGTAINVIGTNTTNGYSAISGIKCLNYTGINACYWLAWNGTNSSVIEYNIETNSIFPYVVSNADCTTTFGKKRAPAMADIDRDSNYELIFACDYNNDNQEGIIVWDVTSTLLDIGFSTDGIMDNLGYHTIVAGIMISNVNADKSGYEACLEQCYADYPSWWQAIFRGICYAECNYNMGNNVYSGGDSEIIVTHYPTGTAITPSYMMVLQSNGDTLYNITVHAPGINVETFISPPATQDIDGDGDWDICAIFTSEDNGFGIKCYEDESGIATYSYNTTGTGMRYSMWNESAQTSPIMADIDNDEMFELIAGGYYYNLDTTGILDNHTIVSGSASFVSSAWDAISDLNDDGEFDICGQQANYVFCSKSSFLNQPPVINNSWSYGGITASTGSAFGGVVCLNSNVTFSLHELDIAHAWGYYNDGSTDQERLATTCGNGTELFEGNYDLSEPQISCVYNSTGSFNVRIYLQDAANPADYSQYNTQTISFQVVDGTPGITCNNEAPADPDADTDMDAETATNDALEGALGDLFGSGSASDKVKMIIGLGIILGIIVTVLKAGGGFIGAIMAGFIGFLLVTFIGLIPGSILIIGMVGLVLMIVIGKFIFSGGTGGN